MFAEMLSASVTEALFGMKSLLALLLPSIKVPSPRGPKPSGYLNITDSRTNRHYEIPIHHNAVEAIRFKEIKAPKDYHHPADKPEGGLRVLDQGFQNTAVMASGVTYVDGIVGSIRYRDVSISDLVGKKKFEDVSFLLIWGHLPSQQERENFRKDLAAAMDPPKVVTDVIQSFPPTTPLVTMVIAGLSAWAGSDPTVIPAYMGKNIYQGNLTLVDKQIIRALSALGTVTAMAYCRFTQRAFTPANPSGSFIENMLIMMGFVNQATGNPDPKHIDCLERLWVLYADHELTNSTAAFLHVASTLADPYTCSVAGIAAAYGPLHGGAIDTAFKTIQDVGKPENVPKLIEDVKAKKFRLFGYGHRIYKTVDPRSVFIRELLDEFKEIPNDSFLAVALEIDRIASKDKYFTSRQLHANADLYGSFVYVALGFPAEIILPLAMVSRSPGVMAHWREAMGEWVPMLIPMRGLIIVGNTGQPPRLWRPQQVYTGLNV